MAWIADTVNLDGALDVGGYRVVGVCLDAPFVYRQQNYIVDVDRCADKGRVANALDNQMDVVGKFVRA